MAEIIHRISVPAYRNGEAANLLQEARNMGCDIRTKSRWFPRCIEITISHPGYPNDHSLSAALTYHRP
jgi:hypothetical protein